MPHSIMTITQTPFVFYVPKQRLIHYDSDWSDLIIIRKGILIIILHQLKPVLFCVTIVFSV
jgi:hypothetical protein